MGHGVCAAELPKPPVIGRLRPQHRSKPTNLHQLADATLYPDPTFLRSRLQPSSIDFPLRCASLCVLPSSSITMRRCELPKPPPPSHHTARVQQTSSYKGYTRRSCDCCVVSWRSAPLETLRNPSCAELKHGLARPSLGRSPGRSSWVAGHPLRT